MEAVRIITSVAWPGVYDVLMCVGKQCVCVCVRTILPELGYVSVWLRDLWLQQPMTGPNV